MALNEICGYFVCFVFFSFIGWAYESIFYSVQLKRLVNSGFLHGCLCPIYGIGGMALIPVVGYIQDSRAIFLTGLVVCSLIEYFISWLLETLFDTRWWDYSDWPLNINGRVCAVSMIGFGFASLIATKLIIPATLSAISTIPEDKVMALAAVLAMLILCDIVYTIRKLDDVNEKLWFVDEHSKLMEKRSSKLGEKWEDIKSMIKR